MHQSGQKPILYRQGVIKNNLRSQKNESETYAIQLKQKQQQLEEEMNDARYQYLNKNYTDEQKLFNCMQALKNQKNGKIEPLQKQAILTYIENLQFFIKYQKYYDISEVMEICEPKQLQKGEPLFLKGEIANSFYILLEGEAAVIVENNIKKKIDNSQEQSKKQADGDDNKINFVSQSQKDIDITKKVPLIQTQYNLNEQNNNLNKLTKNQEKKINTVSQNMVIGNYDHNNNINLPQNSQNTQLSENLLYPQKSKFFKQSFDESQLSQLKSSKQNQNLFPNFKFDMSQNKNDTSYNLDLVEMKESKNEVFNQNNIFRPNININKSEDQNSNSQKNKNSPQQNTDYNGDQCGNFLNINNNNNNLYNNSVKPKITNKELRRGSRKLSGINIFDLDNSLLKSRKKSIVLQPMFSILMEKKDKLFCDGLTTLTWKDIKNPFYFLYKNIFCPKIMKKGDQFGESSLLTRQTRTASIIAQTDCYLIQISKQNYKKYFHKIFQQKLEIKRLFLKSAFSVSLPKAIENQLLIEINISLKFQYNQILFHQNDIINNDSFVYIIKKGQVQIYVDIPEEKENLEEKPLHQQIKELKEIDQKSFHRKGPNVYKKQHYKQKKICIFGPGEFIGLDDFVKNRSQRQYTVQAKSKVSVFGIRKNRFLQLIDEHYMIKETFINKAKKYHKIFQYMEDQKDANNILAMLAQDNQDQEKYIQKMPKAIQKKISQVKSASNLFPQDIYIYENKQKQNLIDNNSALKENQQKQQEKEQINKNSNIFDIDAQSEYLLLINDADLFKPGISSEDILKYKSQEMGTQIQKQQSMLNKQKNFTKKQQIQKVQQNQQKQIIQQNIKSLENIEEQQNIENEESLINNVKSQFNGQKKQFLSNNINLRNSQNQAQIIKAQELFQKIKSNNLSPSKSQISHTSSKKPFIFSNLEKNNSNKKILQDRRNNNNFVSSQNHNNSKYINERRQIQSAYQSRSLNNNQKKNNQLNNQNLNIIKNDSNQNIYENTNEFYNSVKETEVTDFSVDKQQQNQPNFQQVKNNINNRNCTEEDINQETQNSIRKINQNSNQNQNTTYPKFQSQQNNNMIKINFSNKNPNFQNKIPEEENEDNFNSQQLNSKKKNFSQKFDSNLSTPSQQQVQKKQLIFQNQQNFTTKSQQSLPATANFSNYVTSSNLKHMKSDNQLDNINNNFSKSQQNLRSQIQSLESQNEYKTDRKQIYDIIQECRQQGLNALQVSKKLEKLFPDEKKSFLELKLLEKKDDFHQVTIENPLYQDNHYNQLVHYSLQCRKKELKKTQEKKQRINIVLNPQMFKDCQLKNKEKLFRIKNKKIGKQPFQSFTIKSETSTDINNNNNCTEPSIQQNINECQYDKQYQIQMQIDKLLPEQQYKNLDQQIEGEDLNLYQFGQQNNNKKSTTHTHRNYFKPKKSLKFKNQNLLQIKNNTGSQKQNINQTNQQQVATESEFNNYYQNIQPFKKNEIYKMFNQFEKNVKNPKIIKYSYNNQEESNLNQYSQKNQQKLNILENYLSNPDNQLKNNQNMSKNTQIIGQQNSFTSLDNFNNQQLQNKYNDDSDYISNNQKTSDKTQINENLKLKKSSFYQQTDYNDDYDQIYEQEQNQEYDQIQTQTIHQNKKYKQTQNNIDKLDFKQKYPNQKKVSVTSYIQFSDSNLNTIINNKKQN
ncbi:Cyclic nucleotide-binding protein [Pseudocohnilembus persalinus]|uniref:Cyclic nucleotide-binding protein n=1 Tax=Pseudocohnilembus persalinus TaxID=266149 RepID=A0A0V0QDH8_PSEPJ|nr:Cyclic nucleotide-binding protein [Pseudocohnilembus persalinus]|eukprot:KRX00254.1 Cyclic nucleotide-binding protein [Pseudocohnilembus persalinus]